MKSIGIVVAILMISSARIFAADSSLLQFADDRTGIAIYLPNSERAWNAIAQGEFYRRLIPWATTHRVADNPGVRSIAEASKSIQQETGRDLREWVIELGQQGVLLLVYPKETGQHDMVLLLRSRDAEVLTSAINHLARLDRNNERQKHESQGTEYFRQGKSGPFIVQFNDLVAISLSQELIEQVITKQKQADASPAAQMASFWKTELLFAEISQPNVESNIAAAMLVRPTVWTKLISASATNGDDGAKVFADWWNRCEAMSIVFRMKSSTASLEANFRWKQGAAPGFWGDIQLPNSPSRTYAQVPADAWLVYAGSWNPSPLVKLIHQLSPQRERAEMEKVTRVLRGLLSGGDPWDEYLTALSANSMAAVRLTQEGDHWRPQIALRCASHFDQPQREALDNLGRCALNFWAATINAEHAGANARLLIEGDRRRMPSSYLPVEVSYQIDENGVTISDTPASLDWFMTSKTMDLPTTEKSQSVRQRGTRHALWINARPMRKAVSEGTASGKFKVLNSHKFPRLLRSLDILELFDTATLSATTTDQGGQLQLSVHADQP